MSITLYGYKKNARTTMESAEIVAALAGVSYNLEHVNPYDTKDKPKEYLETFELGLVPALVEGDLKLIEVSAISRYFCYIGNAEHLLGKSPQERALVDQWVSFANAEWLIAVSAWLRPAAGMVPWEQSSVDEAIKQTHRRAAFINKRLEGRRYLVGDSATIADAFLAAGYWRSSMFVLDDDFRAQYPNLQKWFEGVAQEKAFKSVIGEPEYAKKAPSGPPKKG